MDQKNRCKAVFFRVTSKFGENRKLLKGYGALYI